MEPIFGIDPIRQRLRRLSSGERIDEAIGFLRQFARETGVTEAAVLARISNVRRELARTGTYWHTSEELAYGARAAWRNHARCIGRLTWKSLDVRDCRGIDDPAEIAAQMFEHGRLSLNGGNIRSFISVFAPAVPARIPATIESPQLLQFAGYLWQDGSCIGDRRSIELTRRAVALGWYVPAPGPFDILPLLIRDSAGRRHLFDVPQDLHCTVSIEHPDVPEVARLGLRWYALPCVTNLVLTIGGIDYPCAPFSGHYIATEVASRDLADQERFDGLWRFAEALGLRTDDAFWRDTALTELNRAVLCSFRRAGVRIVDHHQASTQFMEFVANEQREGRRVSADSTWIVPPQACPSMRVFHLPMQDLRLVPNFYASRHSDGDPLRLYRGNDRMGRIEQRWHRLKGQWRDWRRRRHWRWER